MCGLVGYVDMCNSCKVDENLLIQMTQTIVHRGPDSYGYFIEDNVGLGFRRLSIIDLDGGDQPLLNEDHSVVLMCNGEIYNYQELRHTLIQKGHVFRTKCDVEVLLHLYEEEGVEFLSRLNGQFAVVIYDRKEKRLFLARDHFGINPLYHTVINGVFIFASEIKAILQHPLVRREVDLTGLDQILSFPGLVSPFTMFKGIESLKSGHYILIQGETIKITEYWDLNYPRIGEISYDKPESYYVDQLKALFTQSVRYRLQADVPVGFYLSGGLDSSMVAGIINRVSPNTKRHSFSICFTDKERCESAYQRLIARDLDTQHHEIFFDWSDVAQRLERMIYHCECPVKETYNTCSMVLSEAARNAGIPVILTGEGADELFAGYIGYRFDRLGIRAKKKFDLHTLLEDELREKLWGDKDCFYEKNQYEFREIKTALYSSEVKALFEDFDCLNFELVNKERLKGRDALHQRSYLDFRLRMVDHLLSDHGDKMALANSVEARYPFLDLNVVEFATEIPPDLKLNQLTEKYILRKVAEDLIPQEIIERQKFGWHSPGSSDLLQHNVESVHDLLSYDRIKRQGYFNPDTIERLKLQYSQEGFRLNLPFESDLLMIVLTFGLFLEVFKMPNLN